MTKQPFDVIRPKLDIWHSCYLDLYKAFDNLELSLGDVVESPLYYAAWRSFERYTGELSQSIGDENDWLNWWLYEPATCKTVQINGRSIEIATVETLAHLIAGDYDEESEK